MVTNSARSVAEGTSSESAAAKAGSKGGEKKDTKESAIAGLPTSSTIDVFDFVEGKSSKFVSVKASIKKEKEGGEKGSKPPLL
jgi:hypothetical protein